MKIFDKKLIKSTIENKKKPNIIYEHNSMSIIKNHKKIKLSSEKNQNKTV